MISVNFLFSVLILSNIVVLFIHLICRDIRLTHILLQCVCIFLNLVKLVHQLSHSFCFVRILKIRYFFLQIPNQCKLFTTACCIFFIVLVVHLITIISLTLFVNFNQLYLKGLDFLASTTLLLL